jgi:hypothetical protein
MNTFLEKLFDGIFYLLTWIMAICYFKFLADALIEYNK